MSPCYGDSLITASTNISMLEVNSAVIWKEVKIASKILGVFNRVKQYFMQARMSKGHPYSKDSKKMSVQ